LILGRKKCIAMDSVLLEKRSLMHHKFDEIGNE